MDEIIVEVQIFNPRSGHNDTYEIKLNRERVEFALGPLSAVCNYREGQDPEWRGKSLFDIFHNDSIYAPKIFPDLIEHAWLAWRNNELSPDSVDEELQLLAEWLNQITRTKPNSDFWRTF